jgi:hypothetical protein
MKETAEITSMAPPCPASQEPDFSVESLRDSYSDVITVPLSYKIAGVPFQRM